jgi:hypothetical protein
VVSHVLARPFALVVALVLAVAAGACSGDAAEVEADPETALREAVEAIADWEGIRLEVRLDADETARASLLEDDELTEADLDVLLDAALSVTAIGTDDPERGAAEVTLVLAGEEVAQLRSLEDERLFVRLDLETLQELGEDSELAPADVQELVMAARMFGLGDVAEAAVEGRWIEVVGLDALADLGGPSDEEVDEDEAEATAQRIADRTARFVDEDLEVTRVGSDDVGEHVRATTSGAALRDYLEDVVAEVDTAGLVDEAGSDQLPTDLDELPADATIVVDAWIRDGELRQVAFDVAALGEPDDLEGELWVVVGLEEFTGTVDAPDGATTLDLFEVFGGFLGGGGFDAGGFDDDAFLDDDGADPGAEDGAPTDDAGDDAGGDDGFDDGDLEGTIDCITDEELAEIETFLGEEGLAELEALIDAGILERC